MTSIKRPPRISAPLRKPPAPKAVAAPAPRPSARLDGLSAFVSKVERAVLDGVSRFVEQRLGAYPTPAQRPARTAELMAQVEAMGLSPQQRQTLSVLAAHGVSPVDLWHGSHVVFDGDQGKLYEQLESLAGAEPRLSSHYPGVPTPQYQLTFGAAALLFGTDANGNTWLQMEGHAAHTRLDLDPTKLGPELKDDLLHGVDYLEYLAMGKAKNLGPLGTSPHSEHHDPVHVRWTA